MAINSDMGDKVPDEKQYETGYYSYILRIWKTASGAFKGYILDPITNKTYPVVSVPDDPSLADDHWRSGALIEPIGCRLAVWSSAGKEGEPE